MDEPAASEVAMAAWNYHVVVSIMRVCQKLSLSITWFQYS